MRKLFLGAAAIVAMAAPGVASAEHVGYVGLDYATVDIDGVSDTEDTLGVSGATTIGDNFALDAGYADNDDASVAAITGHVFGRTENGMLGVFAGYADADEADGYNLGVEGQRFMSNVTLAGAISYSGGDESVEAWGTNGEVRYFFNDNFRIEGGLGWFALEGNGTDADVTSIGVGGEYQFGFPVSVGLAYAHLEADDFDISGDAISATVRYNFGGSLRDRDHSGAGLAGLSNIGSVLSF